MSTISYMTQAERALRSAVLLMRDEDRDGAIDRAYYCAYCAACAAIHYQSGNLPEWGEPHFEEVEAAFRRDLVETKILPRSFSSWFQEVHGMHRKGGTLASNEEPWSTDDAIAAVTKASELLSHVRTLVGSPDYNAHLRL